MTSHDKLTGRVDSLRFEVTNKKQKNFRLKKNFPTAQR